MWSVQLKALGDFSKFALYFFQDTHYDVGIVIVVIIDIAKAFCRIIFLESFSAYLSQMYP